MTEFINENKLTMSITQMADELKSNYNRVYNYMSKNNLHLTEEEKLSKTSTRRNLGNWSKTPWNNRRNLVTMYKVNSRF